MAAFPWRRGADTVVSSLSVEAPEFVPSCQKGDGNSAAAPAADGNCYRISLDAYSDEEELAQQPPLAENTKLVEPDEKKSIKPWKQRPWRTANAERTPTSEETSKSNGDGEAKSDCAKLPPPWKRKPAPWAKKVEQPEEEPQSATASSPVDSSPREPEGTVSVSFDSTSVGSTSPIDSSSSFSSPKRSRSPTPQRESAESEAREDTAAGDALSIGTLMQWRYLVSPSEGLEAKLDLEEFDPSQLDGDDSPSTKASASSPRKGKPAETAQDDDIVRDRGRASRKLQVSETSWVSRQRERKMTVVHDDQNHAEVVRSMKSILNKLTLEKFDSLSGQLIHCGINNSSHLELLIKEVFDKATTEHHFINMYADLCALLHMYFLENPIENDPKMNFKKILLNQCQASFESHLVPPAGLGSLKSAERTAAEISYKKRMLGNIRLVGALCVRKMLASKVMLAIMEELLQDPTPEALESLAALLMVVGPTFDTPDWPYRVMLNAIFAQISNLTKDPSVNSRVRCLLKDVIEIRNLAWQDKRPKQVEGPKKLDEVAAELAEEDGKSPVAHKWESLRQVSSAPASYCWEQVEGPRIAQLAADIASRKPTPKASTKPQDAFQKLSQKARNLSSVAQTQDKPWAAKSKAPEQEARAAQVAQFDRDACRAEVSLALAELRVSHDVPEAATRIVQIAVPPSEQPGVLRHLLSSLMEESSTGTREVGFKLITCLFTDGHWDASSLAAGLSTFCSDTCADLKLDVPALPKILRDELHPALSPLVAAKLLDAEQQNQLLSDF